MIKAIIIGDFQSVSEDGTALGDLNATDVDGLTDGSYYSISDHPVYGNATIDPIDGNWSYTPHFFGDDNFTPSPPQMTPKPVLLRDVSFRTSRR